MNDSSKLQSILDSLTDLLFRTWLAFLVAKKLDPFIDNNDLPRVHYFFVSVWVSCIETTLLGFSKLMAIKKKEVSIDYLLNMCVAKPREFTSVSQTDMLQTTKRHREQIEELNLLIQQVKMWRDKAIAHLDRKYINDPSTFAEMQPVDMEEIGKSFLLMQEIINVYREWLKMGQLRLQDYELEMTDEWDYLVGLIQRNGLNKG